MPSIFKIELKDLEDLVRLVCSLRHPIIYKLVKNDTTILISFYGAGNSILATFVNYEKEIGEKYIIFDSMSGRYKFSNEPSKEPRELNIVLIEIKSQNIVDINSL